MDSTLLSEFSLLYWITETYSLWIFSISFATAYAALLEKKVKWLTVDQGVPFGLAVWIAFHLVIMPLMKTVPSPKDQPLEEHISEALGHIAWMWTNNEIAEIVLKQLGQRKKER